MSMGDGMNTGTGLESNEARRHEGPEEIPADPVQPLRLDDLADRLALAGLPAEDAKVFLHLVVNGGKAAGVLARELQLNRAATYRVLSRLGEQDLVRSAGGHPSVFTAAPIDEVLEDLVSKQQARVRDLERLRGHIIGSIEALRRKAAPTPTSVLKVIRGRQEVLLIADLMMREAEESIHVSLSQPIWGAAGRSGAFASLARRREEGVAASVVGPADLAPELLAAAGARAPSHVASLNVIVVDRKDALLWVIIDPSTRLSAAGDQAMWTNEAAFGQCQAEMVDALHGPADPT